MSYRIPPVTGPATRLERFDAYIEVNGENLGAWIHRAIVLGGLVAIFIAAVQCSARLDTELWEECEIACTLSGDTAYNAPHKHEVPRCMCLSEDGNRYDPYKGRTVCAP